MNRQHSTMTNLEQIQTKSEQIKAVSIMAQDCHIDEMTQTDIERIFSLITSISGEILEITAATIKLSKAD